MHCLILTEEHFVRESVRLVLDVLLPTSRICAMGGRITEPPRCDLLVIDLPAREPEAALTVLRTVRRRTPAPGVIVFSASADPALVRRAVQLGAGAYLHHQRAALADWRDALKAVCAGDTHLCEWVMTAIESPPQADFAPDPAVLAALTARQRRAAELVGLGEPDKVIADALGVSVSGARAHLQAVYRKLGIHRRPQLVRLLAQSRQSAVSGGTSGATSGAAAST